MEHQNTFNDGLNMDISEYLLRNSMMRNCKNMRLLDLDGTSYAITTIRGTSNLPDDMSFTLSPGFIPIASREYNNVLYIFSGRVTGNIFSEFELGSFPSPVYDINTGGPTKYAPFQNLNDGPFNVDSTIWNIASGDFVDMGIQPEYDNSVNVIIVAKNNVPRIINSGFDQQFNITERRGGANTNEYTTDTVDSETRLVLRSQKITNLSFIDIDSGGKLLSGNYVYAFKYMTADFNETDVFNQSSICSVFEGYSSSTYKGSVNAETTKRVRLQLSNIDTAFAYIKVYFQYSTGMDAVDQRVYELVQPILIAGKSTYEFIHDGYEETREIAAEAINLDFTAFDSATSQAQAQGYLLLGGIKQNDIDYEDFIAAAQGITCSTIIKGLAGNSPYTIPENIYKYLSAFSGETYPYGIVFILPNGSTSPVFPIQGYDPVKWNSLSVDQQTGIKEKGLYRFEEIDTTPFYQSLISATLAKGLRLNLTLIPQDVKDKSIGFFIVRGERKPDLISQGIVIPTLRVPPFDLVRDPQIDNLTDKNYYKDFNTLEDYKNYPILDSLIEPWKRVNDGGSDETVIDTDGTNRIKDGYMPSVIKNFIIQMTAGSDVPVKNPNAWAYFSSDYIVNEAEFVTALQRPNVGFKQIYQVKLKAVTSGKILNKYKPLSTPYNVDTSLLYKFDGFVTNISGVGKGSIIDMVFVPPDTFSTGHEFVSGLSVRFEQDNNNHYYVRSLADAYFGINMIIPDVAGNANSPYNQPILAATANTQCDGPRYANVNTSQPRAYLINIYPRITGEIIDDINLLYESIDGLTYHQISDRIDWLNAPTLLDVYGGDCYIGEVHKRLNKSGYADPKEPSLVLPEPAAYQNDLTCDNINQGIVFSFMNECKYNPALRLPYQYDVANSEERTFYPFRNEDINQYRTYRLHETNKTNRGYGETLTPKTYLSIPEGVPYIGSNFFSRVIHSEKHVPNAYQNGYRTFIGVNYKDYDPDMGEIVRIFNYRDQLMVVFEHGIGIGPINQRIQTGSDSAGAIYVEPSGVLPPNLGFASRKIGCQHGNAMIQTPEAIYGLDANRRKIWQFREGLQMISDNGFQSYMNLLNEEALKTARFGYDPNYHEVIFTVGQNGYEWTLCFKEGLERFTSFYSYKGYHYAHRAKDFYSFNLQTNTFDIHNVPIRTIYGNIEESYVEFTFNPNPNWTKVVDYLTLISNEVSPKKIDLYTYGINTYKEDILDEGKMFQHSLIEEGVDIITQENRIKLRDRKFVAQVPNVKYINDEIWGNGRLRNKYVIIRVTYDTDQKVELVSVITSFRMSKS